MPSAFVAQHVLLVLVLLGGCLHPSRASAFLAQTVEDAAKSAEATLVPQGRLSILRDLEEAFGDAVHHATVDRIADIEDAMRQIFSAMPKSVDGTLLHAGTRYVLNRYLSERHAWHVPHLADHGQGLAASAPQQILNSQERVRITFEKRLDSRGLNLHEVAAFAAAFEDLVNHEVQTRLNATLKILRLYRPKQLNASFLDRILETYMLAYIEEQDYHTMSTTELNKSLAAMDVAFPAFNETRQFLSEARTSSSANKTTYTLAEVEALVRNVSDQYGFWQDRDCQDLKQKLLAIEDRSIGINGSGRVRLADFYASALKDGNWQFSESEEYLSVIGALDDSDPLIPRVIIPNYISGMSNCIATSKFYHVCCLDECNRLMSNIERRFQAPTALPSEIAEFIATLPSSSAQVGRDLHPTLLARLEEISELHHGLVPLHGRLFAQWMHHAYPRECPYPHVGGSIQPQKMEAFQTKHNKSPKVEGKHLQKAAKRYAKLAAGGVQSSGDEECTSWSQQEELYVAPPGPVAMLLQRLRYHFRAVLHLLASLGAISVAGKNLYTVHQSSIYAEYTLGKGEGYIV